jgi:hypothetical protein
VAERQFALLQVKYNDPNAHTRPFSCPLFLLRAPRAKLPNLISSGDTFKSALFQSGRSSFSFGARFALCLLEGPCRSDITRRRALNISERASHGASNQIYCVRRAEILMEAKDRPPGGWKNGASCTHTKRWSGIPSPSQKRRRVCVVFRVESRSQNNVIYLENVLHFPILFK